MGLFFVPKKNPHYASDEYLMNEEDFSLKKAIEEKLSITLGSFHYENSFIYRENEYQFSIQKELANEKYRVITLTPKNVLECADYNSFCFNIILDKDNNNGIVLSDRSGCGSLGEVSQIKENSIVFYRSFQDETQYITILHAFRPSDQNIYVWVRVSGNTSSTEHYYLWSEEIEPTEEIKELFQ